MENLERALSPEIPQDDAITAAGMRTRDKIFRTIGNTVEITADTTIFAGKATGYAVGKTVNGIGQTIYGLVRGIQNSEFPHSV